MSKFKRALSMLLALIMALSMFTVTAFADTPATSVVLPGDAKDATNGGTAKTTNGELQVSKYYDPVKGEITLEAYVVGSSEQVPYFAPLDIVLVLDVSGSMKEEISSNIYTPNYDIKTSGTYYYKSGAAYNQAHYCSDCSGWYTSVHWTGFISGTHYANGTHLIPKTSASDTDSTHTQFYTITGEKKETKLKTLQTAVNGFIDTVSKMSPESNVAIVKFASNKSNTVGNDKTTSGYNYSQVVKGFTALNSSGASALKTAVNSFTQGGATRSDYGMEHARDLIKSSSIANDGREKVVIMFTDGVPTTQDTFNDSVANAAVKASKEIKATGATVYTVGIFKKPTNNTKQYMNAVSSNYPNASNYDDATYLDGYIPIINTPIHRDDTEIHDYFKVASDANDLIAIFEDIGREIGGAAMELPSTTVLKDVISDYFDLKIPDGVSNASDAITAYSVPCTGFDTNGNPIWGTANSDSDKYTVTVSADKKTIDVTGFDYSKHWVGYKQVSSDGEPIVHDGAAKLVVVVPIEDNGTAMGLAPTNNSTSGIYKGDGTEVLKFPIPKCYFPYYTVVHVQQGTEVDSSTQRVNGDIDLTALVPDGYLYGGGFSDAACTTVHSELTDGKALDFTPTDKATYYIWEVDEKYLVPKNLCVWLNYSANDPVKVVDIYLLTAIDRELYSAVGFDITDGATHYTTEYNGDMVYSVVEAYKNSALENTLYVKNGEMDASRTGAPADKDDGYIGVYQLADDAFTTFSTAPYASNAFTYRPFWITLDGVKVSGVKERTATYKGDGYKTVTVSDTALTMKTEKADTYSTTALTAIDVFSYDSANITPVEPVQPDEPVEEPTPVEPTEPVAPAIVVTVNDNGNVYDVPVENGTVSLTYAGVDGMLFAGWFTDEACTVPADFSNIQESMTVYAKYVSNTYLQLKYIDQSFLRRVSLLTSHDNGGYREVGFIVNGETVSASSYNMNNVASIFGRDNTSSIVYSNYSLRNAKFGDEFVITPYWVTADGTTVYGTAHTLTYTQRGIK